MFDEATKHDRPEQIDDIVYALHGIKTSLSNSVDDGLESTNAKGILQLVKMTLEKAERFQEPLSNPF